MVKTEAGYFDTINNEFVITNMKPLRPLKNYLWNEKLVGFYDQFGFGLANGKTDGVFRALTNGERLVFIKDKLTGEFYSSNRNYFDLSFDVFETRVGLGYQKIVSEFNGVRVEYTIVVPRSDYAEISHVKIINITNKIKKLFVYTYNKPFVNLSWHDAFTKSSYLNEENALVFSHIGYNIQEKNCVVISKASEKPLSFDVTNLYFKGHYSELSSPIGVKNKNLSSKGIDFDGDPCSAMQFDCELSPHEAKEINVVTCFSISQEKALEVANKFYTNESFYQELDFLKKTHDNLNKNLQIETGNEYIDLLENTWLKRQISLGKTWGRVYGKGFRDILQDTSSFLSLDSEFAREKILYTLTYQKENGNSVRQFDPILDYPYQDGPVWIPQTVLAYLKETNNFSILDEKVNYYESQLSETVFEHMERGFDYLLHDLGPNGLVKWRGGDWNDSIEAAGLKGIGESVWLSIATIKGLNDFLEIVKKTKYDFDFSKYNLEKEKLIAAIEKAGFDEDHYIYGITDENKKIGAYESKGPKVFLNPQTWTVLADIGTKEKQNKLMDLVEEKLGCDFGYLQSDSPFIEADDNIGRITYFAKGTYENGSVYNHGVAFKIYADFILGRNNLAFNSLNKILPTNPLNKNNGMEPYAIANMYFGPLNDYRPGFAPSCWITGTAGWIYRSISEMMLGIKPDYDGLIIDPHLPDKINNVKIKRVYQKKLIEINIRKTGKYSLRVNGIPVSGKKVFCSTNDDSFIVDCEC